MYPGWRYCAQQFVPALSQIVEKIPIIELLYEGDFLFFAGEDVEDVQRGCFNSLIGSLITEEEESTSGCFKIPSKFGTGTICLCDTDLCNSSKGTSSSWTTSVLCLAGIIAWRWFT